MTRNRIFVVALPIILAGCLWVQDLKAQDSLPHILRGYNELPQLKELVASSLQPRRNETGALSTAPVPEALHPLIAERLGRYGRLLETKDFGVLYKEYASIFVRFKFWKQVVELTDAGSSRFVRYYPTPEQVDLKACADLISRLAAVEAAHYFPHEIVEMAMIEQQQQVDEICEAAFLIYMSQTCKQHVADLKAFDQSKMEFTFSRHGVKAIVLGDSAMMVMADGQLRLFFLR